MNPFSLQNRDALVTGSSQGIGHALGLALGQAGASVIFHGHKPPAQPLPAGASFLELDLTAPGGPEQLIAQAVKLRPILDLLVCNAGSFFDQAFLDMTADRFDRTMQLNVRATYFLVQAFARHLRAAKRGGSIVIVSSTNGFQSEDDSTAYDASKGAVVMLTRTLAQALAPHGIRVNGIAPGLIRTPLTAGVDAKPELRAIYEKKILLGRLGQPADCGGAVVFLLSDAAAYITGHIIVIDGGLTVGQIGKP